MLRLPATTIIETLINKLESRDFEEQKARTIAEIFVQNSLEGVYSHGINRFPRFLDYVDKGLVIPDASPSIKSKYNAVQQWDGNRGPGITNALFSVESAMRLSEHYGIGCVALANTNHWMRGGTYGRIAAKKGYIFIGWTNTIANLPAWGAIDRRLGNNPLVMAIPGDNPIVIDMAMSQYSYGKLEDKKLKNEDLPLPGGYDTSGALSINPEQILESGRPIPVGYWKGAGLSLLLDLMSTILADGLSTVELSKQKAESGVSQVFICINPSKLSRTRSIADSIKVIIDDYKKSIPEEEGVNIIYPGERTNDIVSENERLGIPMVKAVWEEILKY
ncbi:3-dehydro-L-gulonate 2-dehydrogenase [Portibacter lacus]|uniref:2,3-diketo-L-gulonate reductase n=1 Tax=Portibacter lacus TaxID=1099794 RepID=A0AA37SPS1_9BACT|nr:3-dehydro-L-gulonate 2-dehydrogenase [Portibacter lacus]GLR17629.1 2,3-diketo-L-gulonate reductase [Portibacter lacus]